MKKILFALLMMFLCWGHASGSTPAAPQLPTVSSPPVIDGALDESAWAGALRFSDFRTMKPDPGLAPSEATEVLVSADSRNLYIGLRCHDRSPERIKASLARRDSIDGDDWISIELDPFNSGQTCYLFRVNPLGIQADGMLNSLADDAAGYTQDDLTFDTQWQSRGRLGIDGYEVEVAIPFSSLRFPGRDRVTIGLGVRRLITRRSEISTFPGFDLKKGSWLVQRQSLTLPKIDFRHSLELIPAFTGGSQHEKDQVDWRTVRNRKELSLSGRYSLSPELTLDATFNPDFSQVESDAGQIDLNLRNPLFFDEKRTFFLEGMDELAIAGGYAGMWMPVRSVIHTRAIVDPQWGVKLTGKFGARNSIYSLLTLDEGAAGGPGDNPENALVGILRYKRALFQDGYIGGFFTLRNRNDRYNHVLGVDGRLRFNAGSRLEYNLMTSLSRDEGEDAAGGLVFSIEQRFSSRRINMNFGVRYASPRFATDLGYVNRMGLFVLPLDFRYSFFPGSNFFQRVDFLTVTQQTRDTGAGLWETFNWIGWEFYLPKKTWLYFGGCPSSEVFADRRFNTNYLGVGLYAYLTRWLYLELTASVGHFIHYDPAAPQEGSGKKISVGVILQPLQGLRLEGTINYADLFSLGNGGRLFSTTILRQSTTWQLNRFLFFRAIAEYNTYYRRLSGDFLASFTWIPGTVLQAGYGSVFSEMTNVPEAERPFATQLSQTQRSFFFKASYLLRL
jgi:hypothetical protein